MSARSQTPPQAPARGVIRPDVEAMLRNGLSSTEIHRETGVPRTTIVRHRTSLGLTSSLPPGRRVPSLRVAFESRTQPAPGDHLVWTGSLISNGVPGFSHGGRQMSAYRVAFFLHADRWPDGQVRPGCEMARCVAPEHVEDAPTRFRIRAQYAALTGQRAVKDRCKRGHLMAEHARYKPSGRRYCATCVSELRKASP